MRSYKIKFGIEAVTLESHVIEAKNKDEAQKEAYKLLTQITNGGYGPKFYNYMVVEPIRRK